MVKTARVFVALFVLFLLPSHGLSPSFGQAQPPKLIPPTQAHPKLETVLQALAKKRQQSLAAAREFARQMGIPLKNDSIKVIIEPVAKNTSLIDRRALENWGGVVEAISPGLMRAEIPLPKLVTVADTVGGITFIRRPHEPRAVVITGEGTSLTGASQYHTAGYYGQNTKVAVIDLGFNKLTQAKNAGEIPASIIDSTCTKDYTGTGLETGTEHGTAVAEIVHEIAPQAKLCLMKISDEVDLENAKNDAILYGADIINHSVAWFNTSFYDGTGIIADIAASARDNNILWVNAAGNEADGSLEGHWQGGFVDADGDKRHDFSAGDECNDLSASAGETIKIFMTWDDWPSSNQDYDLFLYKGSTLVASSTNNQTGLQPPTEAIYYNVLTSGTYCFAIYDANAPNHPALELYVFKDNQTSYLNLQYHHSQSSIPEPGNDEKVLTVGAIYHGSWTTGPQESYSSQGPTNNSKYATSRTKPDLMGPDGVSNYTYGAFYGTSASSPHVAGAAALLLSEDPSRTADQLQIKLEADAIDMGTAGKDNIYGSGRLNLLVVTGTSAAFRVTKEGNVYADRAYYCGLASGCLNTGTGADIAEYINTIEPVEPGDVVELIPERPGYYRRSRSPYSTLIVGVISSTPGITMGGHSNDSSAFSSFSYSFNLAPSGLRLSSLNDVSFAPLTLELSISELADSAQRSGRPLLALMGVVPVKATAENGPIKIGDFLTTSSTPGYATRCGDLSQCTGAILGKALEPLEEGAGAIMIQVTLR